MPEQFVGDLRARLDRGLDELRATSGARPRPVVVTEARLERHVCDGWQRDPVPFVHDRANVRGALANRILAADVARGHDLPAARLVDDVWREVASSDPGDPGSRAAWLNRVPSGEAADLRDELSGLLATFREVWPPLPPTVVEPLARRRHEVVPGGGVVRLRAVPDLLLTSRRDDGRARTVVVDFRSGLPRGGLDRTRLRFQALLVALVRRRPPFRWVTFHVSEGRAEVEDLDTAPLRQAVDEVLATVRQLLAPRDLPARAEQLAAGPWCRFCARLDGCEVAARARATSRAT